MTNPFEKPKASTLAGADFALVRPERSEKGMNIVVLERIVEGVKPEYCIHGQTKCYVCNEWCWLGDQTHDVVRSGYAAGVCLECATEIFPPEGLKPTRHLHDHRRAAGPH